MIKGRKKEKYDIIRYIQYVRGLFGGGPDGEGPNVGYNNNMNCWLAGFFFFFFDRRGKGTGGRSG